MNAIARALAESEASYTRCCKAVSASPERMFAGGATGITYTHSSLTEASEQYRHFRGPVFNAVSAISRRIAGLPICVGKKSKKPSRAKAYEDIELIHGHEVASILADPNELQTQFGLLYSMAASILLTGRTTVWMDDSQGQLKLWYLPSHYTQPADNLRGE